VIQTVRSGDTVEYRRGQNRAKITQAANGTPPLDAETAKKLGINININWGELALLLAHARRQYYNSFLRGTRFFRVSLPFCPERFRAEYEDTITTNLNRPLKASRSFFHLHQYRWTDVVVHGPAAVLWPDKEHWLPRFIAREDLRIATDTETDFGNLDWFANRRLYTIGELTECVWGEEADPNWDKGRIKNILKSYKNVNYDSPLTYIDWETQPEKMAELVKQNLGFYQSDALPKIPLWEFYFKDTDRSWYLRVVPDTPAMRGASDQPDKFLYETDEPCADDLSQLLHCQFGDLNFKTPFMFHSVRSLGFELLEPTYWTNLTRCRFLQHVHENFNRWIQITDPANKERAQAIEFPGPTVRVPPGVHVLSKSERHQIDPQMVQMAMAQLKQLMQEASSTYTQDIDTGTRKEQTAFETGVKVQQVNAMLSGLILAASTMENFFYREICRRFCLENSGDKDVQEFQRRIIQNHGIPRKWLNVNYWDIEVEAPLGAGNPTMEQVEAEKVLQLRPLANPTAQQEMLHDALTVFAGAKRAARWAPIGGIKRITDAQIQAQADFGSLMWGIPVPIRDELNPTEQIDVLLNSLAQVIGRIQQQGGVPQPLELTGLMTVGDHIGQLLERLEANPAEKENARALSDALGQAMNEVKAFQQRLTEQMQRAAQEQEGNGQLEAIKAQTMVVDAALKSKIKEAETQQNMRHEEIEFQADQQRENLKLAAELERQKIKSASENAGKGDSE